MYTKCSKNFVAIVSYTGFSLRELERDAHHRQAEERHPARSVGLLEHRAVGQRLAAIDDGDVVEAEEPALEDVQTVAIHLVDPPREIDEQLVEAALEKCAVGASPLRCFSME